MEDIWLLIGAGLAVIVVPLVFVIFPSLFAKLKNWFESLIIKTVSDIVANFWDQQSKRMEEARRNKQKKEAAEKKRKEKENKIKNLFKDSIVLDTSVLIDGRVLDVAKSGFLMAPMVVPAFVVEELHRLADSDDTLKRRRGRYGLDVLKDLKKVAKVTIYEQRDSGSRPKKSLDVDKRLVSLAKKYGAALMTLDFNLNKVAGVSSVKVLNLNNLSNALRAVALPGETLEIEVSHKGKEKEQGVGYLKDGTMVVVSNGADLVGKRVIVTVDKMLEGPAGKMIFGKEKNTPLVTT